MTNQISVPIAPNSPFEAMSRIFQMQSAHQYVVRRTTAKERIRKLRQFHDCVARHKTEAEKATWDDFRKNETETAITELGVVLGETRQAIRHLKDWMRTQSVGTPMAIFGSSSEIMYEPKGVCLIIAPWNFPINLSFSPLISAVAAGNCVIIKPSEFTVHCSALIKKIVEQCFPPEEVAVFEGDASVSAYLLEMPFNHIFFTGSPVVGKIVMTAAAKNLASVTLELGGKSPVIVDQSADLDNAASKIAWLNAINAGQICIAPDYVLVHAAVRDELIQRMGKYYEKFYGSDAPTREASPDYCRMVNARHFERVSELLKEAVSLGAKVNFGGQMNDGTNYIAPTLLSDVPDNAKIWSEEIFGPLLPFRTWTLPQEAIAYINADPQPLAMYIFSKDNRFVNMMLRETRSGGVTVNDCGPHFYNSELPFGGVNNSGIGKCHGHFGFLEFSNQRGVVRQTRFFPTTDLMMPPYGGRLAKLLLKGILRWF
jgi:aldehyde dehydrogenase (NAD+)